MEPLIGILATNPDIDQILSIAQKLKLPNWYLGGGSIAETVWNYKYGKIPTYGIKDYDLIYFDQSDLSQKTENEIAKKVTNLFSNITIPIEVVNEARVHLWYQEDYGYPISPLKSAEDGINTWPSTATAIGITKVNNRIKIYAPFGLDDLLNLIIRPNKTIITQKIYQNKVNRWQKLWPKLTIIPWDE